MSQAMMIATVMEFVGALTVGSRVADTIKTKVVQPKYFVDQPAVLMLGMLCALVGSSTWLTIATSLGLPVSTTHCIVGGVVGMGIATLGSDRINWGWEGTGVGAIIASWVIAPAIAGCFAAILFTITKYGVLKRSNPLKWGFVMVPIYFALTTGVLTMLIVWKGAASLNLDHWGAGEIVGTIFGVAGGVALLVTVFFLPYLHRLLVLEDWTLKPWHILLGPLLLKRGPVPPVPEGINVSVVQDYYAGKATKADLEAAAFDAAVIADMEHLKASKEAQAAGNVADDLENNKPAPAVVNEKSLESVEKSDVGPWYLPKNLLRTVIDAFMHGVRKDVISAQQAKGSRLGGDIQAMHARAAQYDNKAEHLYSFLQILTAATASFAHGANDVSNAIGPLSTIYTIWESGAVNPKKNPVPLWVLAYGGAGIVIGLWTYGYKIMSNLGNKLTLMSPTRGFSMELGSAITVVMATRLALPVSTTQCIVGATMGVALCNGDWRALNWRMVGWCYSGWVLTLPIAGIISGCLMGIIINAPHWSGVTVA
ncbi:phosphate-repressible phosphate permease [Ascodesmis nigricans]|uniref:Phosphate transporter n=1 Tax=Ascodesmis nigricans TaxID=341454 RepID=A0A4S2MN83_9PEZI|nr:phosphate-repressible phosphate permease [Ascodesmis nigricans]